MPKDAIQRAKAIVDAATAEREDADVMHVVFGSPGVLNLAEAEPGRRETESPALRR
jgi:hypothetical protein